MPKPLWLTSERLARFRELLAQGEPTAVAIAAAARAGVRETEAGATQPLVAAAVAACLDEDRASATAAAEAWTAVARRSQDRGNLGRAEVALAGAAIHDAVRTLATDAATEALRVELRAMAQGFRVPDLAHGDPHHVINNHWGVSHAAAAIAAMSAHDGSDAMRDLVDWARGRVRAYLRLHGDAGLYHEGVGYQLYPAAFWLPFILASRAFDGADELLVCAGLRNAPASLYAFACPSPGGCGSMLSWNDAGRNWCDSGAAVLLLAIAPKALRGALRRQFDALNGIEGDRRFGPRHAGLFFALAAYPFDEPPGTPDRALPRWVVDNRQGFVVVRDGYRDPDDAVLGGYARVSHPGGHTQDDSGSLRLRALGHDWIVGGGQNRPKAEWQSLVTPADGQRPQKPHACGALVWTEKTRDGGVFGMDLRRPSQAYAERWVAVRSERAAAAPTLDLVVLDMIDDHTSRDWHWNLSFGDDLTYEAHSDGAGFDLVAPDGTCLTSRFLGQVPEGIGLLRMPDSTRTYQGGVTESYPGLPFVRASFPNHPHRAILWVACVRQGRPPRIGLAPASPLAIRIDRRLWRRPFGAGVAASFDPCRGGTPSRHPEGVAR